MVIAHGFAQTTPRRTKMIVRRLTRIALIVSMLAAVAWTPRDRVARAAPSDSAAPGQLTMLNRQGVATGLCPLRHTDVAADIAGYVARVTVRQEFFNPSKEPIEAIYSFPLPNDAAVDEMTMTIGTRIVRGQVKRKEEARAIYEAAKASGQAAALLDQERPNIFTQQVANITPGAGVIITISYVNLLKYDDGRYEFVYPMVVGPRYIPGGGYVTAGQRGAPTGETKFEGDPGTTPVITDAQQVTPPIAPQGTRSGHDISLTVRLDAGLPIQAMDAGLHKVSIVPHSPSAATIALESQREIPNKDFILRYTAAGSEMAEGLLAYAPARAGAAGARPQDAVAGYFTMVIQPPLAPPKAQISPKEMVFVIDQTGSQSGWPIAKAKETMKYCIANMNPDDTFQLIGFNTSIFPCFPAPVRNTPENVAKALKFLEPIEGNGGTDILKSVDYALNIPDDPDRLRIVCYMTDGYVGNDMQIIDYIRKHRGRARIFPFGIGNSVNRFLIDGMAREGRGAAEYVAVSYNQGAQYGGPMPESGVKGAKECAERFYHRIASPLLLDVQVDWHGLPVEDVYPKQIPDVFSSGPIILKGRYSRATAGDITIHGLLRGQPWSRTIHVTLPVAHSDGSAIPTLWAREKIEDLQGQDWLGAQTNSPQPEIQQQIINTALEYHLMSQYTSFVAVEERVVNIGGRQRTLDVPVDMPEGVAYDHILPSGAAGRAAHLSLGRGFGGVQSRASSSAFGAQRGGVPSFAAAPAAPPAAGGFGGGGLGGGRALSDKAGDGPRLKVESEKLARKDSSGARARSGDSAAAANAGRARKDVSAIVIEKDGRQAAAGGPSHAPSKPTTLGYGLADADDAFITANDAARRLREMTPSERRALIEQVKLSPPLLARLTAYRKTQSAKAPAAVVQIWIGSPSAGAIAKLRARGFTLVTTLTPGRLLLGSVPLDRLDGVLSLPFVRLVELPKFK